MNDKDYQWPQIVEDPRAVLLKPGDLLVIANVGKLPRDQIEALHHGMQEIKEALGFAGVVIFEQDVAIGSIEERAFEKFREANRG